MSEDWAAVGRAIIERLDQLGIQQKELAAESGVSTATIREIQSGKARRRRPRVLRDISKALGWPESYLGNMLSGQWEPQDEPPTPASARDAFLERLAFVLEHRLGPVVDKIYESDAQVDVTIEIRHSPRER